ncbi:glycosyltransferase family 2 protein [Candidatus Uhrbacteria bacterium]|nr:glycosyltransferase family 2 protein [Candidatus Uhrbacteria bacterium]
MISIIIPSYNQARSLPKTLESILTQTMKDIEIILVNDGSTDDTEKVLMPYRDRITYIAQENKGCQVARNVGLGVAKGEYIIVCDADIIMKPDMLEKMSVVLNSHPDIAFVYSSFYWGWKLFLGFPFDVERLKEMNYINTASLVRRELYPLFDVSLKKFQDWDIWLTLVGRGQKGQYIPEVLFSLGERKKGISTWLPRIMYRIPWKRMGIHIKTLDEYEQAKKIIIKKHNLL